MRNRTADLLDANETLYQLSYSPRVTLTQDSATDGHSENCPQRCRMHHRMIRLRYRYCCEDWSIRLWDRR